MGLGKPASGRVWLYLAVVAALAGVVALCVVTEMNTATVKPPVYDQVVFAPQCAQSPIPDYGNRDAPITYCPG
jgi:hypothetical protein